MTHSLLLLLKGPMQSWGDSSRYKSRETAAVPTKSGIVGLIAAAQGRRRSDPLEDLAQLRLAVRVDQPGTLLRDYQTAQQWQVKEGASAQLVTRYYLSDAAFVAAVESEDRELLEAMAESLRRPRFPLFLGRRSCPAPPNLVLGIRDTDAVQALVDEPWHASPHHRKARSSTVYLPIHRDAKPGEAGMSKCDVPISFSQEHRQYGWRTVVVEERKASFENDSAQSKDRFFDTVISS